MSRVIGPGGAGVVVVTPDTTAAEADRAWLAEKGHSAVRPADAGLRDPRGAPGSPNAAAEFWALAVRRPAVAADGDEIVVALPAGKGKRVGRSDVSSLLGKGQLARRVAVFGGAWVEPDEPEYGEAERLGRLLAEDGIEVVSGGYEGIMAAVSGGAARAGGTVVGVTITAFSQQVPVNRWLTHEVEAADLFARLPLICDAEAWVAFPGGVGTLSEVALCWNLIQTESVEPRPLVIVGERWDRTLRLFREMLIAEGVHFDLIRPVTNAEEALERLGAG